MLKITEPDADHTTMLKLEGRLIGPWVNQLRETCESHLAGARRVRLDLADLAYADRSGVTLLIQLRARGVELVNCSPFLVEELKPAIDAKYATKPGPEHTFMMGSSMGGLVSIYAMNEYPQVFGGAAGLSTHWMGSGQPNAAIPLAAFNYLRDKLAAPEGHRLYMDHGTTELDAGYAPYQAFVNEIVRDRGYTSANSMSRVFEGAGHNERAWAARLEIPLTFLMGVAP